MVSEEVFKMFSIISDLKSMGVIDPQGVVSLHLRGLIGTGFM